MNKNEEKNLADNSRGFPEDFVKRSKKAPFVFIHKHGDLDQVSMGGGLLARTPIDHLLKDLLLVVKESGLTGKLEEGHVFLGLPGHKNIVNAYIEKIEGGLVYISSMSGSYL